MRSPPSNSAASASAPATRIWAWRSNMSKKRSSFGMMARTNLSILYPQENRLTPITTSEARG